MTDNKIMTREEAIDRLVDLDVQRWGEAKRDTFKGIRLHLSHGRALNSLAHYDPDNIDEELAAVAKSVMTDLDRRMLFGGG